MAKEDQREGTIAFAAVRPASDRLGFGDLRESLVPGQRATTYGRTWVLSQPHDRNKSTVHGHIGIVTDMEVWDHEANEFKPASIEGGFATPYLLNHSTGLVVFQTRGSRIKAQSFVNALEHLLNAGSVSSWDVTLAEREMPWEEFVATVDRIERLSIRVDSPNPRFRTQLAERLVADTASASATLSMRADETGSIDTESEVVEALMEHAEDYGETTARGTTGRGGRVRWKSKRQRAQVTTRAPADPESGEVPQDELWQAGRRWNEIPFFPEDSE